MKPIIRLSRRSCVESTGKEVGRMTKSMVYIGVMVLVTVVLLAACVIQASGYEVLSNDELAKIKAQWAQQSRCMWTSCSNAGDCDDIQCKAMKIDDVWYCYEQERLDDYSYSIDCSLGGHPEWICRGTHRDPAVICALIYIEVKTEADCNDQCNPDTQACPEDNCKEAILAK